MLNSHPVPNPGSNLPPRAKRRRGGGTPWLRRVAVAWEFLPILQIGAVALILYGALVAAFGAPFLPGGGYWVVLLIWAAAHAGGHLLSHALPVFPPLLGMLAAGIVLKNVPGGLVEGLPYKVESSIRYGCIAICFLMSGLEADLKAMGRIGPVALRLLLIPGIVEGLVSAGVASAVFGMTGGTGALFALSLGWLLKPCDPSIVISQCTTYQKRNIGTAKAIPSLLVASASFDDIVAIALYTVCITLAVPSASANKAWDIASAPLQLVFGAALGGAGALVCSATRVWRSGRLRIAAVLACTLANMFFMSRFHLSGAGVLASIVLGGAVAAMWGAGVPRCLSTGPNATHATVVEHAVAAAWQWVGAPLLFGIVGTQVEFAKINPSRVPRSLAIIAAGSAARVPATFLSVSCSHLTTREKVFVALNWLPKATVQSALASAPLDRVMAEAKGNDQLFTWGEDTLVTALLSVLICGPLSVIVIALFGPRLVAPDAPPRAPPAPPPAKAAPAALASADAAALARLTDRPAAPAGAVGGGRARVVASMPTLVPFALPPAATGDDDESVASAAGAAAAAGAAKEEYEDALLADVDADAHALLEAVELEAWSLETTHAAAAGRLRASATALRRHLLTREAGAVDRVDGAREFFRRLAVEEEVAGEGGGDEEDAGAGGGGGARARALRRRSSARAMESERRV